jgi:hypothetical protein
MVARSASVVNVGIRLLASQSLFEQSIAAQNGKAPTIVRRITLNPLAKEVVIVVSFWSIFCY